MGDRTEIAWTDATWNPIVGCSRVSRGCEKCYAERQAYRNAAMGSERYKGLTKKVGDEIRWTGEVRLVEEAMEIPLKWRRPRRIFVNSMSDLFHEKVEDKWIERIFEVMLQTDHTYQILTKRPERMRRWVTNFLAPALLPAILENIWLGVSVEDQATADARLCLLRQTPAVVRFVSYEPALAAVDFSSHLTCACFVKGDPFKAPEQHASGCPARDRISWVIIGGESGPGARPFDLAWAVSAIEQCREAGAAVFMKQVGTHPLWEGFVHSRKGADPEEWPAAIRVREFPPTAGKTP